MRYLSFAVVLWLQAAAGAHAQEAAGAAAVQPTSHSAAPGAAADPNMVRQLASRWGGRPAALAQVIQLSRGFTDSQVAEMLDELAAAHLRAGDLNLAAEARTALIERYASDRRAQASLLWLVRLYASSEVSHARRRPSAGVVALQRQLAPQVAEKLAAAPATIDGSSGHPLPEGKGDQQSMYALHLATQAMSRDADLAENGALVFQRAVAARRAGQAKASQSLLSPLRHRAARDVWAQCARAEQWLADGKSGAAPKAIAVCRRADARPHLDGVFDESCWQLHPQAALSADEPSPTDVHWAYDAEHLYLAIRCAGGVEPAHESTSQSRPRDGDVQHYDHIRLALDIDRDYASCFELLADCRGWTADRCWGDLAWNPQWYVARAQSADGSAWTIEAAIPLAELTPQPPAAGDAWACAVQRMEGAPESELAPTASEEDPASFALLLFE